MARSVSEIVGTVAVSEEETGGLTICGEVYEDAISKVSIEDQRRLIDVEKRLQNAKTPSGRRSQIGEKKAHELIVKVGIFLAGLTDREFENLLYEKRTRF